MAKTPERTTRKSSRRRTGSSILTLLILLAAGGAVFWFGWVQMELGEGEYGVIYTKTGGWESEVLRNGEFAWRWQALLPTNLTVHVFRADPKKTTITTSGVLPSGELYARILGNEESFEWLIGLDVTYRLDPERLPVLLAAGTVFPSDDSLYLDFESEMGTALNQIVEELMSHGTGISPDDLIRRIETSLRSEADRTNPGFSIVAVSAGHLALPDMELYESARSTTLELMETRQAMTAELEASALRREDSIGARLDLLARYGKVLSDYPVLLELFALEGNPGRTLLPPEFIE